MTTFAKPSPTHSKECALLVLSCDAYSDLWTPFFTLLHRNWPDCPFPIYLGAGEDTVSPPDVILLKSNGDRDWSRCVCDYLDALPQAHVLIMLDDFFLRSRVSNASILECLDFARAKAATQLRLIPRPGPTDRLAGENNIGTCAPGSPYRLSTQTAIWDKGRLRSLLREGESIWEFEINGNLRANAYSDGYYCVRRAVLPYEGWFAHHVVEKGKWLAHEKWIFGRQDIGCDFLRRSTLPWGQTLFYHCGQILDRALNILPWQFKARVKHRLKRILRPFLRAQLVRMSGTVKR